MPHPAELPRRITVVEVSPRDGLQAESRTLPTQVKLELITRLAEAGCTVIEATSFVNPKAVPQLADAEELLRALVRRPGVRYPVLVPNLRHVMTTASAIATIEGLAPGRLACGFGTGATARWVLNQKALSWATTRRYLEQLRGLLRGEVVANTAAMGKPALGVGITTSGCVDQGSSMVKRFGITQG